MIKNNGGEMEIKIKSMFQEKEGSDIGVKGSLMSIDHKRGQNHGKGKTCKNSFNPWWNKMSIGIIAYFN